MADRIDPRLHSGSAHDDFHSASSQPARKRSRDFDKNASRTPRSEPPNEEVFFPSKLFVMLSDSEKEDFEDIVSWGSNGVAFQVHKKREFENQILPKYFKMTKYKSFTRQLHNYGFNWIRKGPDKGGYYHADFNKSDPSKCHQTSSIRSGLSSSSPGEEFDFDSAGNVMVLPPLSSRQPAMMASASYEPATNIPSNVSHLPGESSARIKEMKPRSRHRHSSMSTQAGGFLAEEKLLSRQFSSSTPLSFSHPLESIEPRTIEEMMEDPQMEKAMKKYKTDR